MGLTDIATLYQNNSNIKWLREDCITGTTALVWFTQLDDQSAVLSATAFQPNETAPDQLDKILSQYVLSKVLRLWGLRLDNEVQHIEQDNTIHAVLKFEPGMLRRPDIMHPSDIELPTHESTPELNDPGLPEPAEVKYLEPISEPSEAEKPTSTAIKVPVFPELTDYNSPTHQIYTSVKSSEPVTISLSSPITSTISEALGQASQEYSFPIGDEAALRLLN